MEAVVAEQVSAVHDLENDQPAATAILLASDGGVHTPAVGAKGWCRQLACS